jgi:hypothetical protein
VTEDARIRTERLQAQPPEEPALCPLDVGVRDAVRLLVHVDGRAGILVEGPVGTPHRERPGRAPVPLVGFLAWLGSGQVEADDIGGMAGEEPSMLLGADDIVWRRDDRADVGNRLGCIAKGAERTDLGHVSLGTERPRRASPLGVLAAFRVLPQR